jgi:hypothetical protein
VAKSKSPFLGAWRTVEMEEWDRDYIDLVVPGHITFESGGMGSFQFGTVQGWLDCRVEHIAGEERIEFSWEGVNDNDPGCGRGWAVLRGDELHGRIYVHASDDSAFRAARAKAGRARGAG